MEIYFFDATNRYIGHRKLSINEAIPSNATTEVANVGDGYEAYFRDSKWVINAIVE